MTTYLSRRRFITISASTLAAGLVPGSGLMARPSPVHWQGIAMGARAELILNHPNRKEAETAVQLVQDEIQRLERVFSLYDPGSALSQLNLLGDLKAPPLDLIRCLDDAEHVSRITDGAFDITVQPLWELYARHFSSESVSAEGPGKTEVETARKLVDYRAVQYDPHRVSFAEKGMAVTLNGIAQGYITDRVAELLKARGFANVLIDLGETRGMGRREDGSDWQVGIEAPDGSGGLIRKLALRDRAIATSGGYGTRFTRDGVHHHLFDPKTGRSSNLWTSMSVIADDATRADALSTAFFSLPESRIRRIAEILKVSVIACDRSGTVLIDL
jgi:thiamine biosynthesis lipoprotein